MFAQDVEQRFPADPFCSSGDYICVEPIKGAYQFFSGSSGSASSVSALIADHVSKFAISSGPTGRCKIEVEPLDINFPGYTESGAGIIHRFSGGENLRTIYWLYGVNRLESIKKSYKLHHYEYTNGGTDCVYQVGNVHYMTRQRTLSCPAGSNGTRNGEACVRPLCPAGTEFNGEQCISLGLNQGCDIDNAGDKSTVGNPCHVGTGNKVAYRDDLTVSPNIYVSRTYNSNIAFIKTSPQLLFVSPSVRIAVSGSLEEAADVGFGRGWTSNLHKRLIVRKNDIVHVSSISRFSSWPKRQGATRAYSNIGSSTVGLPLLRLKEEGDDDEKYDVVLPTGGVEHYGVDGRILYEDDAHGNRTSYIYTDERLTKVVNYLGQEIVIAYNEQERISSITDPSGATYRYRYSKAKPDSELYNLTQVIYPGGHTLSYHYENTEQPSLLTGITDENGERHATYGYNVDGKAKLTGHAQTTNSTLQEQFMLDFQRQGGDTTIVETIRNPESNQ